MSSEWTGAVLAGGLSRRMGRPKAFLPGPNGAPLIENALDALRSAGATHLLIGANDPRPFAALGVPVVPDGVAGQGPAEGLLAVLSASTTEWTLVVACDMPHLDPDLLGSLIRRAEALDREVDAVVPFADGRLQPLHAAYHRRAVAKIRAARESGTGRLTSIVEGLALEPWAGSGPSFRNVNTPQDLRDAELGGPPPPGV